MSTSSSAPAARPRFFLQVGKSWTGNYPTAIVRLLRAAERNLADAGVDRIITVDALRKQRNVADYSGDVVPESAVAQCIASACDLRD